LTPMLIISVINKRY